MPSPFGRNLRFTSVFLIFALTWDATAQVATPCARPAALQAPSQPSGPASVPPATPPTPHLAPDGPGASARDRLLKAHTVFLSVQHIDPNFAASGTDTYNAVLDALQQWGRYRVVSDPSHADLLFQIDGQITVVEAPAASPDYSPDVDYTSTLALTVADPHTLSPLWTINVPLFYALRRKSRLANITNTGRNAVSELKVAAGDRLTGKDKTALKTIPDETRHLVILAVAGGAAVAAGAIIGVHMMHSNAASFCQQHNLSPCPGS